MLLASLRNISLSYARLSVTNALPYFASNHGDLSRKVLWHRHLKNFMLIKSYVEARMIEIYTLVSLKKGLGISCLFLLFNLHIFSTQFNTIIMLSSVLLSWCHIHTVNDFLDYGTLLPPELEWLTLPKSTEGRSLLLVSTSVSGFSTIANNRG